MTRLSKLIDELDDRRDQYFYTPSTTDKWIHQQARLQCKTKQNYFLTVFTDLQQHGFTLAQPVTPDTINAIRHTLKRLEG